MRRVSDIVYFILENRKDSPAFRGYTLEMVTEEVVRAAETDTLYYTVDQNNQVDGVMIVKQDDKTLRICNMIVLVEGVGLRLIDLVFNKYKTLEYVEANHHYRPVKHRITTKLRKRVESYGRRSRN